MISGALYHLVATYSVIGLYCVSSVLPARATRAIPKSQIFKSHSLLMSKLPGLEAVSWGQQQLGLLTGFNVSVDYIRRMDMQQSAHNLQRQLSKTECRMR